MATLDITKTIDIDAPVDKVWAALTESALIAQWFGDACDFDPTPGGTGTFGWSDHGVDFRVVVELAEKPTTLVYRWARQSGVDPVAGNSTVVRFDLVETANGTRLSLLETGFEELADPPAARAENVGGWDAELGDLVAFVTAR